VTRSDGSVQIDKLNQWERGEALDPLFEIFKLKRFAFSLYQLNDLSV
jgi:hypothetical protein